MVSLTGDKPSKYNMGWQNVHLVIHITIICLFIPGAGHTTANVVNEAYVRSYIKQHMIIHTGERPVQYKGFTNNGYLRQHLGNSRWRQTFLMQSMRWMTYEYKHYQDTHADSFWKQIIKLWLMWYSIYEKSATQTHMLTRNGNIPFNCIGFVKIITLSSNLNAIGGIYTV